METVGVFLKKERLAKNISLSEVARKTKISKFYLDYIENDDYDKLPQGPYIKGYISSYSKLIGSDVEEALKLYDSLHSREARGDTDTAGSGPPLSGDENGRVNIDMAAAPKSPAPPGRRRDSSSPQIATIAAEKKERDETTGVSNQNEGRSATAIGSAFQHAAAASVTTFRLTGRHMGLFVVGAFIAAVFTLAGFGFYHLFLFDRSPATPADQHTPTTVAAAPLPILKAAPPPVVTIPKEAAMPLIAALPPRVSTGPIAPVKAASAPTPRVTDGASPDLARTPSGDLAEKLPAGDRAPQQPVDDHVAMAAVPPPGGATPLPTDPNVVQTSICEGVADRMPVGVDRVFPASVKRVYVWTHIESQQFPTQIRHVYYFKDWKINDVTLDVRAATWRTWSFKTISSERYRGPWRVDITSAEGKVLRRVHFEIS